MAGIYTVWVHCSAEYVRTIQRATFSTKANMKQTCGTALLNKQLELKRTSEEVRDDCVADCALLPKLQQDWTQLTVNGTTSSICCCTLMLLIALEMFSAVVETYKNIAFRSTMGPLVTNGQCKTAKLWFTEHKNLSVILTVYKRIHHWTRSMELTAG